MIKNFNNFLNEDLFIIDNTIKKYEKIIIDSVINFMKFKYNFDTNIIVKKKQNAKLIGDVILNDNSVNNNKFILHFNPNQSYNQIIKSLIHELTHIKQIFKKELKPSNDYKSLIWKNNFIIKTVDYNKIMKDIYRYKELPWEKEAYNNMDLYYDEFINSNYWKQLKGKDINIDFIMDNI